MSNPTHTPTNTPTGTGANLPTRLRHHGWSSNKQADFLRALSETHCVMTAARAVGMSRQSAYGLRARLKGEPFDLAWTAAMRCRFDVLAEVAMNRAINGVEVPHFYRGELIGTSRKYDERLTVALLTLRERVAPRHVSDWRGAERYGPEDFAKLVERVETGTETWAEQERLEYDAAMRELEWDDEALGEEGEEDWEDEGEYGEEAEEEGGEDEEEDDEDKEDGEDWRSEWKV